jgi:large subunit ribosomal protein L24
MKIKVNDQVKILSGKDKGKTGKVIQVFPVEEKIVVEGLNLIKKHVRSRKQGEKGQAIELAGPFKASKAALICTKCAEPVRVGYKMEAGVKKRSCRKCNQLID